MNVHLSLVLLLGCLVVLWLRRYVGKSRPRARQIPTVRSSVSWEITHRFLPVPQCDLKIDDIPFLSRVSSWISGIVKHEQDNCLPDVRFHGRNRRSSAREMRFGFLPRLSIFCYYYLSPTLAIVGILCAVSLLTYQAGWTAVAISSRIQDGVGHSNITYGSAVTVPSLRRRSLGSEALAIDSTSLPGNILTSIEIKRSISAEPSINAVEVPAPYRYEARDDTGSVLQPLIPGITVPLSHAFPLLLALLLSQVIHEAGHLVVAALHNIPPIRIVIGVWAVFPVASVVLPSSVNQLSPKSLLRIAAAGPYHNLLTYFTVLMLPIAGIQHLFYQDVTAQGVYITQINDASPLKLYLPEHVIVYQIDDVPLGTISQKTVPSISSTDMWTAYLLRRHQDVIDADFTRKLDRMGVNRGWCVTEDAWKDSAKPPCPPAIGIRFGLVGHSVNLARSLNESFSEGDAAEHRCFAAYPMLTMPTVDCSSECTASTSTRNMCIRPITEERILRIHYEPDGELTKHQGATENKQVLLYAGDPETVFSDVRIEFLRPRGGKAFRWALAWGDILMMYIATLSLALATLNLLPLPGLDGTHVLSALLSLIFGSSDNKQRDNEYDHVEAEDVELDATTASFRGPVLNGKKRRWHQFITLSTSGLAIICMGGGIILGLV